MMDIDDLVRILLDEVRRKHLHVPGQNHQFDMVFAEQLDLPPFSFRLVLPCHRNDVIRNTVKVRVTLRVRMVADNQRNFAGEFADPLSIEQINETVIIFRNKYGYSRTVGRRGDAPLNGKFLGNRRKPFREVFQIELEASEVPFDAGKIESFFSRLVLLEMKDVATMPVDEVRDCCIQALAIRALQ